MPGTKPIKVSIIMPTYNLAGYILETIQSIRDQTYPYWELIIVDDGSDDNTEEIVMRLNEERIKFFSAGRIGIGGKIKNIGLKKATGDLYAFIDADDVWATDKIEKQVRALQEYPDAGFCLTGGFNFNIPYEPVEYFYKQREGVKVGKVFMDYFRSELPGFTQALMLRRECIHVTGLFKEENKFSDLDFILRLAWHYPAVILYEPLFYRRLHNENYSSLSWEKSYYEGMELIRSYKEQRMVDPKLARESLFNLYINFGEDCLLHKKRGKALLNFFNAWTKRPGSIIPLKKTAKTFLSGFKK